MSKRTGTKLTNGTVDSTDCASLHQLADLDTKRKVPRPDGFHEEQVLGTGRIDQLAGLCRVDGQSLFAKDVLAGLERQHGVLEVVAVGGGDIDDLDIRVGHQLMVGAIRLRGVGRLNFAQELNGAVLGGARGGGHNLMGDVVNIATGWVVKQIPRKG